MLPASHRFGKVYNLHWPTWSNISVIIYVILVAYTFDTYLIKIVAKEKVNKKNYR